MAVLSAPSAGFRRFQPSRIGNQRKPPKRFNVSVSKVGSALTWNNDEKEGSSSGVDSGPGVSQLNISMDRSNRGLRDSNVDMSSSTSRLRFDRLRPSDEECICRHKRDFDRFIAREALLDEEIWTAAWLRAESHWEDRLDVRHVDSFKRQFAEQQFNALKRRCSRPHAEKCICFVAVKKNERNVKRTVLNSVVGTLDLSIKQLLLGETFPGELMKPPGFFSIFHPDQPSYGYVANLCVAKYARRQGIAKNMLLLALEAATSYGANEIFVHVQKDNVAARKLYDQIGFKMVKTDSPCLFGNEKYLLSLKA